MAEPRRDVRRLDDRPLLGGVYLVLYQRPGRLPATLPGAPGRPHLTRPRARRTLVGRPTAPRWRLARRLGGVSHLRHAIRRARTLGRWYTGLPSRHPQGLPVAPGPPTAGRRLGRAPQRLPHGCVCRAPRKPGDPDRLGPVDAPGGPRARLVRHRARRGSPALHARLERRMAGPGLDRRLLPHRPCSITRCTAGIFPCGPWRYTRTGASSDYIARAWTGMAPTGSGSLRLHRSRPGHGRAGSR